MEMAAGFFRGRAYASFWGIAFATGALLMLLVFLFYSSSKSQTEFVEKMVTLRGAALVSALEASVHAEMHIRWNREGFHILLRELAKKEDIQYLAILDESGTILAHSDPKQVGRRSSALSGLILADSQRESLSTSREGTAVLFGRRLKDTGGLRIPMSRAAESTNPWPKDMEKLIAVAAIQVAEFERIRQQAYRQTFLILLVGGLLVIGAVYVSFVFQAYQLAHSNLHRLERVRDILNKFVPSVVVQLLEHEPSAALEKTEQDVTVMFLDIAGYTSLSETMPREQLNGLVERYFASFLDLIHRKGGDVTETAGDGMMVLFRDKDPSVHAWAAAHTAAAIQQVTAKLNSGASTPSHPLRVNIGINSGLCLVGSTKIRGTYGERWTFTASGLVTNVASRLCTQAVDGEILIGPETERRLGRRFPIEPLGERQIKNISTPIPIFRLIPR